MKLGFKLWAARGPDHGAHGRGFSEESSGRGPHGSCTRHGCTSARVSGIAVVAAVENIVADVRHAWLSSPRFIRLGDIDSWAVDPEYNADRLWPEWGTGSQVIVQKSEQALRISAQWISDVLRSIDLSRIQATSKF